MSSDPTTDPTTGPATGPGTGGRPFRLAVTTTIAALVLAAAGLTVANAVQGPRLLSSEASPAAAVRRSGQRVVLQVDQSIDPQARTSVVVTPAVPVQVSTERAALVIRFTNALTYGTRYTITAPVRSTVTGARSTLHYAFTTPDPAVYLLQRAQHRASADTPDQIVRSGVGPAPAQVVDSQPQIQEFAVSDPALAVVTGQSDGDSRLTVRTLGRAGPAKTLVDDSLVSQLKSSGPSGFFGFIRTTMGQGQDPNRVRLQLYDSVAGGPLIDVRGLKGADIDVQEWAFVPGTTFVVVQTPESEVFLIDPVHGAAVQPLGSHSGMEGFIPGTASLILADPDHYSAVDLAAGATSDLLPIVIPNDGISRLLALGGDRGYLGLRVVSRPSGLHYSLDAISEHRVRPLWAPRSSTTTVRNVCLSPNSQYVAVETYPADATPDGYDITPGFSDLSTVFVDTATGHEAATVAGFAPDWCP